MKKRLWKKKETLLHKRFMELWAEVEKLNMLPNTAIMDVPGIIQSATKQKLCELEPARVSEIIKAAIEEINNGSVESLDDLILKRL